MPCKAASTLQREHCKHVATQHCAGFGSQKHLSFKGRHCWVFVGS